MKRATIKDVAKYANVSIATVSRAINNSPLASEEAKARVFQAIEELGYEPNGLARGLVSRKSNAIGILIPDVSHVFFAEILRGMEDAAHDRNCNLFICNTVNNKERMLRSLKFLREKQVDGVIFTSEEVLKEYYEAFLGLDAPVVLVATEAPTYQLPALKVDDHQAIRDAVNYLIRQGHREIGMICGPLRDKISGVTRYQGFIDSLAEHGIAFKKQNVVFGDYRFHSGRKAIRELLESAPEITAVLTSSDEMAIGAIVEASKMGIQLPDQLSIIGFDNVKLAEMSNPSLTTVAQPLYQMGVQAVELLFTFMEQSRTPGELIWKGKTQYVPHQIIVRESVSRL